MEDNITINSLLDRQFPQEQQDKLREQLARKYDPTQLVKQPRANFVTETERQLLKENNTFIDDLTAPDVQLDDSSTLSDYAHAQNVQEKRARAKLINNVFDYSLKQNKTNAQAETEQAINELGESSAPLINNEIVAQIMAQKAMNTYYEYADKYGIPSEKLLDDPKFARNLDPETYKYFAVASNLRSYDEKFFYDTRRAWNNTSNARKFNQQLVERINDGESINVKDLVNDYVKATERYSIGEETKWGSFVSAINSFVSPFFNLKNLGAGVAGAAAGAGVGASAGAVGAHVGVGAGAIGGALWGGFAGVNAYDTYVQSQGDTVMQILANDPKGNAQDVYDKYKYKNVLLSGALALTDVLFLGGTKAVKGAYKVVTAGSRKKVQESLADTVFKNATNKTTSEQLLQLKNKAYSELGKQTAKDVGFGTAIGAGSTGLYSAVTQDNVNDYLEVDDRLSKFASNFGEGLKEGIAPSAILTVAFRAPSLVKQSMGIRSAVNTLNNLIEDKASLDILAKTPLAQRDSATNGTIADGVLRSVYVDSELANSKLAEHGIDVNTLPDNVKTKFTQESNGSLSEIKPSEWLQLPQEIREVLSDVTTDGQGKPLPGELREVLSDKKINKLRTELGDEYIKAVAQQKDKENLELEIKQELANIAVKTNTRDQGLIAHTISSFCTALGDSLGISAREVYAKFKPRFELVNRENLTSNKDAIDNPYAKGTYDPNSKTIQLKKDSSFTDVFHELSHWFLDTTKELAKNNNTAKTKINRLIKWYDPNLDINTISKEQWAQLQERFVARFLSEIITGKPANSEIFRDLKRTLNTISKSTLFTEKMTPENKARVIEDNYLNSYGDKALPNADDNFRFFTDGLFDSEYLYQDVMTQYPIQDMTADIFNSPLSDPIKQLMQDAMTDDVGSLQNLLHSEISAMYFKQALVLMSHSKTFLKDIERLRENIPNNISKEEKKRLNTFFDKLTKESGNYQKYYASAKKDLQNNKFIQGINDLRKSKMFSLPLAEQIGSIRKQLKYLKKKYKDLFNDSNEGVALDEWLEHNHKFLPFDLEKIRELNGDSDIVVTFCNLMLHTPTVEQMAHQIARQKIQSKFIREQSKDLENVQHTVTKIHHQLGTSLMRAVKVALGMQDDTFNMTKRLKALAKYDLDKTSYRRASFNGARRNAKRCNDKVKKALALGDLEGALKQLNNEYYQNSLADQTLTAKKYIDKKLTGYKSFIRKANKDLAKNYDTDIVELMRIILDKDHLNLSDRTAKFNVAELRDRLNDSYPLASELITKICDDIENAKEIRTFYQDQSIGSLMNLINLLDTLKDIARDRQRKLTGDIAQARDNLASRLINSLKLSKTAKRSEHGVDTKYGTATTREETNFDKIKKNGRYLFDYTEQVETLMQKLDGEFLGAWHEFYENIRSGDVAYKMALRDVINTLNPALNKALLSTSKIQNSTFRTGFISRQTGCEIVLGQNKFKGATNREIIGILLHMGTNFEKFLDGYIRSDERFSYEQNLILKKQAFENFFNRAIDEGFITKEMLDFCQAVWNTGRKLEPQVQKASKELRGYAFSRLEGRTIRTKWGDYEAGYVPAVLNADYVSVKYDPSKSLVENVNGELQQTENVMGLKNPSFTKERSKSANPLELDPVKLIQGFEKELRYIHLLPKVFEAYKLLQRDDVVQELERVAPDRLKNVLVPWLQTLATGRDLTSSNMISQYIGKMLTGSSGALMFMNVVNTVQQTSNLFTLIPKVGFGSLLKAMAITLRHPISCVDTFLQTATDGQKIRLTEIHNRLQEIFDEVRVPTGNKIKDRFSDISSWITRNAMIMQIVYQRRLDVIGYIAAQDYGHKQDWSVEKSNRYGEMVVRTAFMSPDRIDSGKWAKSNVWIKSINQFAGYFVNQYRNCEADLVVAYKQYGLTNFQFYLKASSAIIFDWFATFASAELVNQAMGTRDLWSDDDDTFNSALWEIFAGSWSKGLASSMPFVGKIVNTGIIDPLLGNNFYNSSWLSTPLLSNLAVTAKAITKLVSPNKELRGSDIKGILVTLSVLTRSPVFGFAGRQAGYVYDLYKGNIKPTSFIDLSLGLTTGMKSEDSKK